MALWLSLDGQIELAARDADKWKCIRVHIDCTAQVAQKIGQTTNRRYPLGQRRPKQIESAVTSCFQPQYAVSPAGSDKEARVR